LEDWSEEARQRSRLVDGPTTIRKELDVEEKDEKTGSDPEIEAHRRKTIMPKRNEEPREADTPEEEDEVEAHRRIKQH
jgi:hypothetical protein